jgi:excisionase family DNA binding protein
MQEKICPEWLSYQEAQSLVGLGRTTLWRLVSSGEVDAARVGRAVRINRASLTSYMQRSSEDCTWRD